MSEKRVNLYEEVYEELRRRIVCQRYVLGEFIPNENELATEFGVSKITIRQAVDKLVLKGYVKKLSGRGTWVIDNSAVISASSASTFYAHLKEKGYDLERELIKYEKIEDEEIFKLMNTRDVWLLERLYTYQGKPYIYMQHYITIDIDALNKDVNFKTYNEFFFRNIEIAILDDSFTIEINNDYIFTKMQVNYPLLKRIRKSTDTNNNLVEYSISYYDTTVIEYNTQLLI